MTDPIREYDPAALPEAPPRQTGAPRKGRPKGESAKRAASAWAARHAEERRRKSRRVETPEEAIAVWSSLRSEGAVKGVRHPGSLAVSAPVVGDSIDRQIHDKVQLDHALLSPGESLRDRVAVWVPCVFFAPLSPLCDAELAEIAEQEAKERKAVEDAEGEGRLMPGMVRE